MVGDLGNLSPCPIDSQQGWAAGGCLVSGEVASISDPGGCFRAAAIKLRVV